ncbi:MAG: septum formation initiator family protein [Eubacteriales bacterium]
MKALFKNTVVRMSVLVLLAFFIVSFVSLRLRQNDLAAQADVLRAQIDEMDEYIYELHSDLERPFDEEYISEIAHSKLGLRYPQEIIYYSGSEN